MGIVLMIHSLLRWLILIVALAAIVKHVIGLVQSQPYDKVSSVLMAVFSGMMDLQMLLGIIFITTGLTPMYRIEHAVTMILAVVAAHLPAAWKKKEDRIRYRNGLLALVGVIILIVLGIAVLPGDRWTLSM
jgi:uncharacterized membrane protein YphA (DoxX/SURF4 family)